MVCYMRTKSIAPDDNYLEVVRKFNERCVVCGAPYDTVHEIIPKSKMPKGWQAVENRVTVCYSCHDRIHREGTRKWKEMLLQLWATR